MKYYKDSCPQAEEIIKEQVQLLNKRHKNTAFSWLRNIFHDCFVESCDTSLLLDSTRRTLSEKETDRSFRMRNFRYIEIIKEALERECPGVVSCSDILVLSARDGIVFHCAGVNCLVVLNSSEQDGHDYLFTGSHDGTLKRWALSKNSATFSATFESHVDWVNDAVLTGGNTLVSCSSDATVKVWNGLSDGTCVKTFHQHTDYVTCLAAAEKNVIFLRVH
ncbi:hypothetical protein ACS0TY_026788 [Phlomoides rotata]